MEIVLNEELNTSVPASILQLPDSDFNLTHNEYVTHAKLKIFYMGETGDGRVFSEDFSKKIIQSLPQSPVVGYYDEQDEDFKAHHHKQYVYGYVPEAAKIEFSEDEDGVIWAVTDVILFTGRNDNIGEVAKKIIGMQHSLELDPDSVEYVINRNKDGKFESVEFTEGKFIGLSVVGDLQSPAFSGSHFFTVEDEEAMLQAFEKFQNDINSYFKVDNKDNETEVKLVDKNTTQDIIETLEEENFEETATEETVEENVETETETDFVEEEVEEGQPEATELETEEEEVEAETGDEIVKMTLEKYMRETYSEKYEKVAKALKAEIEEGSILQMDGSTVVYSNWTYNEETGWENKYFRANYSEGEEGVILSEMEEVHPRYLTKEEIESTFINQDDQGGQDEQEEEKAEGLLLSESEAKQFEKDMTELQEFRRVELEELIKDYESLVDKDILEKFMEKLDEFTKKELDSVLAVEAMKRIKEEKKAGTVRTKAVKFYNSQEENDNPNESPVQNLIDSWKDKK